MSRTGGRELQGGRRNQAFSLFGARGVRVGTDNLGNMSNIIIFTVALLGTAPLCCSAGKSFDDKHLDENWILEDYQRGGSVKTYWKHIERG